jgi:hypothetical protein
VAEEPLTSVNVSDRLLGVVTGSADGSATPARRSDLVSVHDEVSDAWMLAVADTAKDHRGEQLHVWLTTQAMLTGADMSATGPAMAATDDAELESTVAAAWFEPSAAALAQTLNGAQCEAHVESAVLLGLPRWQALTPPIEVATWFVRPHPMGLALHDPTGQVFARGVVEVPATWTTAAIARGWAVAVYGVSGQGSRPQSEPPASPPHVQRLSCARQRGSVAAAWVPLRD